MGCNFYSLRGKHIGKRSAAGLYCWDCGTTLNKEGNKGVHKGHSDNCKHKGSMVCNCLWHSKCPKCGASPKKETVQNSSGGRELGLNKQEFAAKTGVATCSSFSWAIKPEKAKRYLLIKDEYGRIYTNSQFFDGVLSECPIQYYDFIGREFS